MTPNTPAPADPTSPTTANAHRALRQGSGLFSIDVREGFEHAARGAFENALTCYRDAAKARAAGDEREAHGLIEIAEQSLDLARDMLCQLEGLDAPPED